MIDLANPIISVISPQPSSKNNPLDSLITIRLEDGFGTGVDMSTFDLTINGAFAFNNGEIQAGYDGYYYEDVDGYQVEIRRDALYDPLQSVNVSASCSDLAANPAATRVFSFISLDNVPPQIIDLLPATGTGQVASNETVTFSVRTTPYETEIDINTLTMSIEGVDYDGYGNPIERTIVEPVGGQLSYDKRELSFLGDEDGLGYSVALIPLTPYPLSAKITVRISIQDLAGNESSTSTIFTTSDDAAPTLLNPLPSPDSIGNAITSPITFSIADQQGAFPGSGINKSSLFVTVDGQKAIEGGFGQESFIVDIIENVAINGYDVSIISESLLFPRKAINIVIIVSDNNFNVLTSSYIFTTEDVIPPEIFFISPRPGNQLGLPQNSAIITDFKSEVAVGELDISSIRLYVDNTPAFLDNTFQPGYEGLTIATTEKALTITTTKTNGFILGQTVVVDAYVSDVFGNETTESTFFSVTSQSILASSAFPSPGIFDKTDQSPIFPAVGTFLDVFLSANGSASIAYTIDGTDPILDGYDQPLGTTEIYTGPIRISDLNGGIIRFFAFDGITHEVINTAIYVFSDCPAQEIWEDYTLRDGLEYTTSSTPKNIILLDDSLRIGTESKVGTITHRHDLGRECFIDSLEFDIAGSAHFRVRVADSFNGLDSNLWCNQLVNLADNQYVSYHDGYGTSAYSDLNTFIIEGRSELEPLYSDEARIQLVEPLLESFAINAEMKLLSNVDDVVGAKSFLRIRDDIYNLEVQQYLSKSSLVYDDNLNALAEEETTILINDAYEGTSSALVDGYSAYVELETPPQVVTEYVDFLTTEIVLIDEEYQLPLDTSGIFSILSTTPAVYNQFHYGTDAYDAYSSNTYEPVEYSSAIVGSVFYQRFESPSRTSFAIPVVGKSLDNITAAVSSLNLNNELDEFVPAETNNTFDLDIFLEEGDYNFRFSVERDGVRRLVSNPYQFRTKQNTSAITAGDLLVVDEISYEIASIAQIDTGEYVFDFERTFPLSTNDILDWHVLRDGSIFLSSTNKIVVTNLSGAEIGADASGTVGNLIIDSRALLSFTYASSTASNVSVVGTFNSYDETRNPMIRGSDTSAIEKIFDGAATFYENDHIDYHKVEIIPELPIIVDRVRFTTNVIEEGQQRTRLLLDDKPVPSSNYRAYRENGDSAEYLNNIDVITSLEHGYTEWQYVQIGNNKNRTLRDSIGLITRLDSLDGYSRAHVELDVFTLEGLPQLIADYYIDHSDLKIIRKNKSDFAIAANDAKITYGQEHFLEFLPRALTTLEDNGITDNFLQAQIISAVSSTNVYIDKPILFNTGDNILTSDGNDYLRATITDIDEEAGLIYTDLPIHDTGVMVKDYHIIEQENDFIATLEVPKFNTVYTSVIREVAPDGDNTIIYFDDDLDTSLDGFLGGRLSYALLTTPAKILEADKTEIEIGPLIVKVIKIVIDKYLPVANENLGVVVEIYNSTKTVTDYVFSKTDGSSVCLNQSLLCSGINTKITYDAIVPGYYVAHQVLCLDQLETDIVTLETPVTLRSMVLQDIKELTIDFFNGRGGSAPDEVVFTLNDEYSFSQSLGDAIFTDGYLDGLYDPSIPESGQIVQFNIPLALDGYETIPLETLSVEFTGKEQYCIGEIEILSDTTIINSRCRIVLDEQELFTSDIETSLNMFSKYQIQIDKGSLFVYFNSKCVLQRPILFTDPIFEFGAAGKIYDDEAHAEFRNIIIDQFFSVLPAKIQKVGRFVEIEGTVIS